MFETKTAKAYCEKHDIEYQATMTKMRDKWRTGPCPECIIEAESKEKESANKEKSEHRQQQIANKYKRSGIPPRYTTRTFDNFKCTNADQRKALSMAKAYAEGITTSMKTGAGLILSGKVGTGKTHLACAVGDHFVKENGSVLFITVTAMIRKIRETYRRDSKHTEQQIIDGYRDVDLLIIDEIGLQKGSESEEFLLFETINERYAYFKPTILISNLNAEEIKQYIGTRALDRMREGGGKFIAFDWDSYRSEVAKDESLPDADQAKYTGDKK